VGTVLKGATLVEFEPAVVEAADLRIDGGRIVARGAVLEAEEGDEIIPLPGRLILPGLVSANHRASATALRGLRPAVGLARSSLDALEDALNHEELEIVAAASGLEGLVSGTTTVFCIHGTTKSSAGLLDRLGRGLANSGLRSLLACEVSDRRGALAREEALDECVGYAKRAKGRFRGALGVAQLATLSEDALSGLTAARTATDAVVLISLARDSAEELKSMERFEKTPVDRLAAAGLIGPRAALSPSIHLSWPQLSALLSLGPWMVHTGRSNMASQAGLATPAKFGVRGCLGTDIMPLDVLGEAQVAGLRSLDSGQPLDVLRFLANGQRLASEIFGVPIGPLREGAAADLLVLDYQPPTPFDADTLAAHLLFGLSSRDVESVMIDGMWRLWKRKPLVADVPQVMKAAAEVTRHVWQRLGQIPPEVPAGPGGETPPSWPASVLPPEWP
jgi:cytosine/adenosine deaminase-related metal-dependent hydrolase